MRVIRRNPVYTLTSILLVSASIGLTCTAFGVFDALILRKLPVPEPDQLALVSNVVQSGRTPLTRSMFEALSRDKQGISQIFAFLGGAVTGAIDQTMGTFAVDEVAGDFFAAQGAVPEIGRLFGPEEHQAVAVISDKLWRTKFSADSAILSRSITMGQTKVPIIGVTTPTFRGTEPYVDMDAFFPLATVRDLSGSARGAAMPLEVVVRLKPGVTLESYASHLEGIWSELLQQSAPAAARRTGRPRVESFSRGLSYLMQRQPNLQRAVTMALVLAMTIFGSACLTLALLAIARGAKQQREVAIRLAIGGGRWQVLRPYIAENIVIAGLGCGGGMIITLWWNRLAAGFLPSSSTINWGVTLDARSAGIAIAMAAMAAVIGVVFTALLTFRAALTDVLHLANPLGRPNLRLRTVVLAVQLGTSVILLHYGLAYVGDLKSLADVDVGFDARHLHVYSLSGRLPEKPVDMDYFQRLSAQVRRLPGVESAALTTTAPLSPAVLRDRSQPIETEDGQSARASTICVFPGYFDTLKLPLLSGRDISWNDGAAAIVTESLARSLYPNANALGHAIQRAKAPPLEIVGIAGNIAFNGQRLGSAPMMFIPCREQSQPWTSGNAVTILVRSKRGLADLGKDVRTLVDAASVHWMSNMDDEEVIVAASQQQERMLATVSGIFGGLIVLLTAVGLYAFCNYVFALRSRELAIRAGLGASPAAVAATLLRETMIVLVTGSIIGLTATLASRRLLGSLIVNAGSPGVRQLAVVILITAMTTLAAVVIPTTRAIKMDIAKALRAD